MKHEKQFYILVAADVHPALKSKPSALAVAEKCLAESRWGMGNRLKSGLPVGSYVLIYVAGKRDAAQTFVASAEVGGAPLDQKLQIDEKTWLRTLPLKSVRKFPIPVPIRPLLKEMGFVMDKGQRRWGSRFQGGLFQINQVAYDAVIRASKRKPHLQ